MFGRKAELLLKRSLKIYKTKRIVLNFKNKNDIILYKVLLKTRMQCIKITTPEDFYTMRAILEAKENEQIYGIED